MSLPNTLPESSKRGFPIETHYIREILPTDRLRAEELHAGQSYELPDLTHPLVVVKQAIEVDGKVVAMGIARVELCVTLLLDHEWATPEERLVVVAELQKVMHDKASVLGLDEAFAEVPARWGERLKDLGWVPAKGKVYYRRID